ncbi:PilZ domain-containing protein [Candidatus Merdisoma sp. JLR.KK006]|uniref:PilZ domain-containing protein n=1 Tax=Candidatus Merdisoma sp. JLR.KK006 TaxID=3112626 RepID=UPI002FF18C07
MDALKKCRKAEIYSGDTLICEAEVFRDLTADVWLSIPKDLPWESPETYTVLFYDSISGLLLCHCDLSEPQELSDERDSVSCKILDVLKTEQRRMDLKIQLNTPLELSCTYVPGQPSNIPAHIQAESRDLSAGGIYFISEYQLPPESVVQFQLHGATKPLLLSARVLRTEELPPKKGSPQYGHGCQFTEMKPQTEAVLRNYIFRQERQQRF